MAKITRSRYDGGGVSFTDPGEVSQENIGDLIRDLQQSVQEVSRNLNTLERKVAGLNQRISRLENTANVQ